MNKPEENRCPFCGSSNLTFLDNDIEDHYFIDKIVYNDYKRYFNQAFTINYAEYDYEDEKDLNHSINELVKRYKNS